MSTIPPIPGTEQVLSALGWWPSFHDAEVLKFTLTRGAKPEEKTSEAQLEVQVREYQSRHEGTAQYKLELIKNVVIRFLFTGVEDVRIEDFNFQNVIDSLNIATDETGTTSRFRVDVESIYGFGATWLCNSARVSSVDRLPTSEA